MVDIKILLDRLKSFTCRYEKVETLLCNGDGAMNACDVVSMAIRAVDSVLIFANLVMTGSLYTNFAMA